MAIHGLPILAKDPMRAVLDTPNLLQHLQRLKRWQDLSYFKYGGRVDDATVLFTSGLCPLFSQSSGAYNSLSKLTSYPIGVAALPLDTKVSLIRHANVAGGAALWPVAGLSKEQYRGIAEFFVFLAKPEVQKRWHEHTGYIPIGLVEFMQSHFKQALILSLSWQNMILILEMLKYQESLVLKIKFDI